MTECGAKRWGIWSAAAVLFVLLSSSTALAVSPPYYSSAVWPAQARSFSSPSASVGTTDGGQWVADTGNDRIIRLDASGTVLFTVSEVGTGGERMDRPRGIALDQSGRVFVADTGSSCVRVFDSAGGYVGRIGEPGIGPGQLTFPEAVTVDTSGNVYVADTGNDRVVQFSAATGQYVRTIGSPGVSNGCLNEPAGVCVLGEYLYVTDRLNRRVEVFSAATGLYVAQWGVYLSGSDYLSWYQAPTGITTDGTRIFVSDTLAGVVDRCVPYYLGMPFQTGSTAPSQGTIVRSAVQEASWSYPVGSGAGQMRAPWGLSIATTTGSVLRVADSGNHRFALVSVADGAWFGSVEGGGSGQGELASPAGVAVAVDSVFVSDTGNDRVSVYDSSGAHVRDLESVWVGGALQGPAGLAVATDGRVFVAEPASGTVEVFSAAGVHERTMVPYGSVSPVDLAFDPDGSLWVVDRARCVLDRIDPTNGGVLASYGATGTAVGSFSSPGSVAVNASGTVCVADTGNHRVQVLSGRAAWSVIGGPGSATGMFSSPSGVEMAGEGIWVADTGNDRVQWLRTDGTGAWSWGVSGAARGCLREPVAVVAGPGDGLLIVERANHRVQVIAPDIPPVTSFVSSPSRWNTAPVTIGFSVADVGVGPVRTYFRINSGAVATYTAQFTIAAQGDTNLEFWSEDGSGNVETHRRALFSIDSVPPQGTMRAAGGMSAVATAPVSVESSFTDAYEMSVDWGTGFEPWAYYTPTVAGRLAAEGPNIIRARYRDVLGNVATHTATVILDTVAPVTTARGVPSSVTSGAVEVSLDATDSALGSGIAAVRYRSGAGAESDYSAPLRFETDGSYTITFRAEDRVGHVEPEQTVSFSIDRTPPAGDVLVADGAAAVSTGSVAVTASVSGATEMRFDCGTGFSAWAPYTSSFRVPLPASGPNHLVFEFRDAVGNVLSRSADIVKIDATGRLKFSTKVTLRGAASWVVRADWVSDDPDVRSYRYVVRDDKGSLLRSGETTRSGLVFSAVAGRGCTLIVRPVDVDGWVSMASGVVLDLGVGAGSAPVISTGATPDVVTLQGVCPSLFPARANLDRYRLTSRGWELYSSEPLRGTVAGTAQYVTSVRLAPGVWSFAVSTSSGGSRRTYGPLSARVTVRR